MSNQHTLKESVTLSGIGLHTGVKSTITIKPNKEDSGIWFQRIDLPNQPKVEAYIDNVVSLNRGTTIGIEDAKINTIEHLMAAFFGLDIDNALIEINAEEVPLMDGSAIDFVNAIKSAGILKQDAPRRYVHIDKAMLHENGDVAISASPSDSFKLTFMIDYYNPTIGSQHTMMFDKNEFEKEYATSRSFCFLSEVISLVDQDLIKGGTPETGLVIQDVPFSKEIEDKLKTSLKLENVFEGKNGYLNNIEPRFPNELCRHKALDLMGDLYLLGAPIKGHILAARAGHAANIEFVKKIKKLGIRPKASLSNTPILNIDEILKILPHRYPFLLVDKVIELEKEKRIVAIKNVTVNEPFFPGHFPENPIMPGVLQIEALAQAGGLLMSQSMESFKDKNSLFMSIDKARFRKMVRPGDTLYLEVEVIKFKGKICKLNGKCLVDGEVVSQAEIMLAIMDK